MLNYTHRVYWQGVLAIPNTQRNHLKNKEITMRHWMIVVLSLCGTTQAVAQNELTTASLWGDYSLNNRATLYLASAETADTGHATITTTKVETPVYEERYFTANKVHQYLGIGSILAAGATVLAPKPGVDPVTNEAESSTHETLAKTAAGLGVAAVITGMLFHWDDFNLSDGAKDPDNLHVMLTTAGTLGYLAAVSAAPDSGHAGVGGIGAIAMAIGIKMNW